MKVLVLGSGAREHALVRSLSADPAVDAVIAAPGNPGIAALALCRDIEGGPTSPKGVVALATELGVDLVVVGPEAPLVAGVTDALVAEGIACFGPTAEAARLAEGVRSPGLEASARAVGLRAEATEEAVAAARSLACANRPSSRAMRSTV